jgi:WD40 repeat protein
MKLHLVNKAISNRYAYTASPYWMGSFAASMTFASSSTHDTIAVFVTTGSELSFYRCGALLSTVSPGTTDDLTLSGDGSTCTQWDGVNTVKVYNTATGALLQTLTGTGYFGGAVALSYDGTVAVISAPNFTDGGDTACGRAYVYNPKTGALLYVLTCPLSIKANYSYYGKRVAISYDGSLAVVSAQNSGSGINRGIVFVHYTADGGIVSTLSGAVDYANYGSNAITMTGDGTRYATVLSGYQVVDASTGSVMFTVDASYNPYTMSADGSTFVRKVSNGVLRVKTSMGASTFDLALFGADHHGISHDGRSVYYGSARSDGIGFYFADVYWP